jgi:hypothetical protein
MSNRISSETPYMKLTPDAPRICPFTLRVGTESRIAAPDGTTPPAAVDAAHCIGEACMAFVGVKAPNGTILTDCRRLIVPDMLHRIVALVQTAMAPQAPPPAAQESAAPPLAAVPAPESNPLPETH